MDRLLYPFGAADVQTLVGSEATHAVSVSNRKTLVAIAPTVNTTITFEADDELPVGAEVDVLITVGATRRTMAFAGANANSIATTDLTASGFAVASFVFDGTTFWQKSLLSEPSA